MAASLNQKLATTDLALKAIRYAQDRRAIYDMKARRAVNATREKLPTGSANQLSDYLTPTVDPRVHPIVKAACVLTEQSKVDHELRDMKASGKVKDYWEDQLEVNARWAAHYGCGNCNEFSAVAFVYLRDVLKVRPLDWMAVGGLGVGSHAFVLVGRDAGTVPQKGNTAFIPQDIHTWNTSIVLCDAYKDEVLSYPQIVLRLGTEQELILRYRLE